LERVGDYSAILGASIHFAAAKYKIFYRLWAMPERKTIKSCSLEWVRVAHGASIHFAAAKYMDEWRLKTTAPLSQRILNKKIK